MKKLINISPFLLLLVPVFFMIVASFSFNMAGHQNEEALRATKAENSIIKVTDKLVK